MDRSDVTANSAIECNMTMVAESLVTDSNGKATFTVESGFQYLVQNILHATYPPPDIVPAKELTCSVDACSSCSLHMDANLTLPSCEKAKMHILVRDNTTEKGIAGGKVDVYLAGDLVNTETLVTDANGEVELEVDDLGNYRIKVTVDGMESLEKMVNTKCDQMNCSACATVVLFHLTTTTKLIECPDSTLSLSVLDISSSNPPPGLAITVSHCVMSETLGYCVTGQVVVEGVPTLVNRTIDQDGEYCIDLTAPGYDSTHTDILFNCTPENCQNCSQSHALSLTQVFCDETQFEVKVENTGKPVEEALVSLIHPTPPYSTVDQKKTGTDGIASFPVAGRAEYNIQIAKEGYHLYNKSLDVFCDLGVPCSDCKPQLTANILEHFCNKSVKLSITATSEDGTMITKAQVRLTLKQNMNSVVSEVSDTNYTTAPWSEVITQFGYYSVEVISDGFLPTITDVEVR